MARSSIAARFIRLIKNRCYIILRKKQRDFQLHCELFYLYNFEEGQDMKYKKKQSKPINISKLVNITVPFNYVYDYT